MSPATRTRSRRAPPHTQRPVGRRRRDGADHGDARRATRRRSSRRLAALSRDGRLLQGAAGRARRPRPSSIREFGDAGQRLEAAAWRSSARWRRAILARRARRPGGPRAPPRRRQRVPVRRRVGRRRAAARRSSTRSPTRARTRAWWTPVYIDVDADGPPRARQGLAPALQGPPAVPPPHALDDHAPRAAARRRGRRRGRPARARPLDADRDPRPARTCASTGACSPTASCCAR